MSYVETFRRSKQLLTIFQRLRRQRRAMLDPESCLLDVTLQFGHAHMFPPGRATFTSYEGQPRIFVHPALCHAPDGDIEAVLSDRITEAYRVMHSSDADEAVAHAPVRAVLPAT